MMHGREKSDSPIVPEKPANKAAPAAAEPVEGRGGAKGNVEQQSTDRTQGRVAVSQALGRVRDAARREGKLRFTALLHHVNADLLGASYHALKRDAAAGVDGVTWHEYGPALESNLEDLHDRVHRGAYRALPSRRHYIPKPPFGKLRRTAAAVSDCRVGRQDRPTGGGDGIGADLRGRFPRLLLWVPTGA